ncbi:hypothetical protein PLICRDRAFT_116623 [Plicaturopsis crispa FD-325 SS-3]|uniref:ASTRA-associated protein 1 n=1 Tax=Plicaturopsis crispa FD-325 SS-3 TaxID=944288 RepID=A0A0C9TAD3_PLICR|nr:hypothetical protein PLICRDRAFT_116623 [Plicaturopsis crispa FD-325 SS-3]
MSPPPPPSPTHLLRSHSSPLSALSFSADNERIYSGDASGLVVITSTRTLRAMASWNAHTDSVLGVEELGDQVITHGRDNKLHVWKRAQEPQIKVGSSAAAPGLRSPTLCYSMDVNALNYCRFSLMPLPPSPPSYLKDDSVLIAFPNIVDSSLADIWALPSQRRLHAAIGSEGVASLPTPETLADGRGPNKTGIIMSLHLFTPSSSSELRLICAYEDGGVALWRFSKADKETSVEGVGWETVWRTKLHVESIMAMAVARDHKLALTVSADHLIGRYDLEAAEKPGADIQSACVAHRTKYPGNSAIAIRDDGRVCAVGGWDGKIRLYSTRSLKPLGTLDYHKSACQSLSFAHSASTSHPRESIDDSSEDEDGMSDREISERSRWLVGGGKDNRVSIWTLMDFEKK